MRFYNFEYQIQGLKSHIRAESVAMAIEAAKRQFLKTHYGLDHTHSNFRAKKGGLEVQIKLVLDPMEQQRFRELYRAAKDNCLQGDERDEFNQLRKIVNDKRLSK